ncbi:MAG: hypothetical protein ACI8X5_000749 [Planctomycetota bacterium]
MHLKRSMDTSLRLASFVPDYPNRTLHPLLLEPEYWRLRLKEQNEVRLFLLRTPRPDLSTAGCEVQEIRFVAHDGVRLWGLVGRCPLLGNQQPAALRLVGPCQLPSINIESVQLGCTEFVVQTPAGRRLEDRVLDAVRLCQVAASFEKVDSAQVAFGGSKDLDLPDEARIADRLIECGIAGAHR